MTRLLFSVSRDRQGSSAAEFAMVLPLLLIFLLGIIDVGRLLYTWNEAEKATQMGVRFAVVTDMIAGDLASHDFSSNGIEQGEPVTTAIFTHAECSNGTCPKAQCIGSACANLSSNLGYDGTSFNTLVSWMNNFYPQIDADNIQVEYDSADVNGNNIGYVSDPSGPDIAPLVTVKLKNLTFQPILFILFGESIDLPDFKATLTTEDAVGEKSN